MFILNFVTELMVRCEKVFRKLGYITLISTQNL